MTHNPLGKCVAVVGSGYWGRNLVRNFHGLGALHSIHDRDRGVQAELLDKHPGTSGAHSVSDVLNDPAVRGVAIASPASTHAQLVGEALLAGKDVFVEKPLALTATEGAELATLARERKRVLMVGHLLWYHPAVLKLESLIADGTLGRVQYIYSNRLNMGKLRREENVLWSFAPHDVSVILGLLGDMPEAVQAQGGNFLHQRIADTTLTLLAFASGVRAHIFVSWLHPFKEQKLVVVGDQKMAVFDDTAPWPEKLQLYSHVVQWKGSVPVARKADAQFVELPEGEPLRNECGHFLECMHSRAAPRTDGEEGLRVLQVLNACERALSESTSVRVVDPEPEYFVHESAVVEPGVTIGRGTKIWHFSHILGHCDIGEQCVIGQNASIGPNVRIGNGCKIQNNVSIFEGVTLEDDVFCGPSMVFTNVHNPRAHVARRHEFRPTLVRRGATIGANATIVCGHSLGRHCFIGAGAVVTRDVPDHAIMVGNPARQVGWMSEQGERLGMDLVCPVSGKRYQETELGLEEVA